MQFILMLSIEKCKNVLNRTEKKFTDEEIKLIREYLDRLSSIAYQEHKTSKYGTGSNICESINRRAEGQL